MTKTKYNEDQTIVDILVGIMWSGDIDPKYAGLDASAVVHANELVWDVYSSNDPVPEVNEETVEDVDTAEQARTEAQVEYMAQQLEYAVNKLRNM